MGKIWGDFDYKNYYDTKIKLGIQFDGNRKIIENTGKK